MYSRERTRYLSSFSLVICGCTVKVAGCGSSNGVSDTVSHYAAREDPCGILGRHPEPCYTARCVCILPPLGPEVVTRGRCSILCDAILYLGPVLFLKCDIYICLDVHLRSCNHVISAETSRCHECREVPLSLHRVLCVHTSRSRPIHIRTVIAYYRPWCPCSLLSSPASNSACRLLLCPHLSLRTCLAGPPVSRRVSRVSPPRSVVAHSHT